MSLSIERMPVEGATRDALTALGLPSPEEQAWAGFAPPQVRTLLVAREASGIIAGAALTSARPLASYLKISGIWVSPEAGDDGPPVVAALVAAAEQLAWESGHVVVKREVRADTLGYDAGHFGPESGYASVPAPLLAAPIPATRAAVPSAWFKWRSQAVPAAGVPYMRQTTDFTCGAASLTMVLARSGIIEAASRDTEIALWRQATTMPGCDPYGLAVTARQQGLPLTLIASTEATLFTEALNSEQERQLREFIQGGFREEARRAGITTEVRAFDLAELRALVAAGGAAIVLVDTLLVTGEECPHWIVVHGLLGDHFLAHDPWTEWEQGESWVDAYDVPLTADALDQLAWTGTPPVRAMLAFPAT